MIKAIEVKALKNYQLFVKFNDGVEGVVDLSHLKNGEAFKSWNDPKNFEKVYLDGSGIAWNEDLDVDALNIYLTLTKQSFVEFMQKQKHHAQNSVYGDFSAQISIVDFALMGGNIPRKALSLVIEWASIHKNELMDNWDRMLKKESFKSIEPLQ